MGYDVTLEKVAAAALKKSNRLKNAPLRYIMSCIWAGMWIGIGIILIFTIGSQLSKEAAHVVKLVQGLSFAIALVLVIMTGVDLFTGNNMVMTAGSLNKSVSWGSTVKLWVVCWLGNLVGAIILSLVFVATDLPGKEALMATFAKTAIAKASGSWLAILAKGILCNILVCVAVLVTFRTDNDAAKILVTFMCLFAFITSGYEHSIANMTVYGVALFTPGNTQVTLGQAGWNLLWATIGNVIGGGIFVGLPVWFMGSDKAKQAA